MVYCNDKKDKSDSRYAHPVFKTSQNIAEVGTTLWLLGIPTTAVGGVSFLTRSRNDDGLLNP